MLQWCSKRVHCRGNKKKKKARQDGRLFAWRHGVIYKQKREDGLLTFFLKASVVVQSHRKPTRDTMVSVQINSGIVVDGSYAIYSIVVHSQDRTITVPKRFSDFIELKKEIEKELNESLDYKLPSKFHIGKSTTQSVIESRKPQLEKFLNDLLNDKRVISNSLSIYNFLQIPRSSVFNATGNELIAKNNAIVSDGGKWTSDSRALEDMNSKKWLDVLKECKSLLQDIRSKMFNSNYNSIELRKSLDLIEIRIAKLGQYLNTTQEFGQGELARRRDMLNQIVHDYNDLKNLNIGLTHPAHNTTNNNNSNKAFLMGQSSSTTSLDKQKLFTGRTLGKPKETDITRQLDNSELYQYQQQVMQNQDQDVEGLRGLIQRQKEIGLTINEELNIQNDLLRGLNDQVDKSSYKLSKAKNQISKIL